MFSYDKDVNEYSYTFISAFHLGIPFAICRTSKSNVGWNPIRRQFADELNINKKFETIEFDYGIETQFPLGKPLTVRHLDFYSRFNLPKFIENEVIELNPDQYNLDNLIWICPSGVVLVMGKISFNNEVPISFSQFEVVIENHYAELAYLFIEVAEILIGTFSEELYNTTLCRKSDIENCVKAIKYKKDFSDQRSKTDSPDLSWLHSSQNIKDLFEDILIDVYYIEFKGRGNSNELQIEYIRSSIKSSDPLYFLIICIVYSSFIGFIWLKDHLSEQSDTLKTYILKKRGFGSRSRYYNVSLQLKLFRIFCLQFINESSPISIRLTETYMARLEECWEKYRMHQLVNQVNDQLMTFEKMFDWIDEISKEARNFKIGISAVLLALISIMAVIAQLVSTIDINYQLDEKNRFVLILCGFVIGVLCTLAIYMLPITKRYTKLKFRKSRLD